MAKAAMRDAAKTPDFMVGDRWEITVFWNEEWVVDQQAGRLAEVFVVMAGGFVQLLNV